MESIRGVSNMQSLRRNTTAVVVILVIAMTGCCHGVYPETISTTKVTWEGKAGTAIRITQSGGTKELEGVKTVGFELCGWQGSGEFWEVADFTVPVMKLEPNGVTVFFSDQEPDPSMLQHLLPEFRAGKVGISGCHPDRTC